MKKVIGRQFANRLSAPSVCSIGNFDGVHLGHQALIKSMVAKAKQLNAVSTVITFDPLAREYFNPTETTRINSLTERLELIAQLGVEQVFCIDFLKLLLLS